MNLLAYFETSQQADTMALLLNSHGIVTHVSSQTSKGLGGISFGVVRVGVWAVLEHQYEDALALMEDPQHVVTTGMSPDEYTRFSADANQQVFSSLNKAIAVGIVLIGVMVWLVYRVASAS